MNAKLLESLATAAFSAVLLSPPREAKKADMHCISGLRATASLRRLAGLAGTALTLAVLPAVAQVAPFSGQPGTVFSPPPPPPQAAPARPAVGSTREPHQTMPAVAPGKIPLALAARFSDDGPYIPRGLHWRVFFAKPDSSGAPSLAAEAKDSYPVFALAPGDYVVHASYGLASTTRRVHIGTEGKRETLVVPGGGLRVQGRVGEFAIASQRQRFDVYEGSFLQRGGSGAPTGGRAERPAVVRSAIPGDIVLLPAGVYYIQSTYGEGNSVIQADVRIEPGRLTDATVNHRASQITLKLVSATGGEAIANTQWSVLTPGGDSIKESIGAFPSVVLAEGEYVAVARHDGRTYQQNFRVDSGRDREIEVLAR
jgi:hypothetical protein